MLKGVGESKTGRPSFVYAEHAGTETPNADGFTVKVSAPRNIACSVAEAEGWLAGLFGGKASAPRKTKAAKALAAKRAELEAALAELDE